MVGFTRKNPKYNVRTELHKRLNNSDGSNIYYENEASKLFYSMDKGFATVYVSDGGHVVSEKTGTIETMDLRDGDIMPDDYVLYAGEMYIVTKVVFADDEKAKMISKRPPGITTIELRR